MDNIRSSLFGYNKTDVKNLIFEKDQIINTQQKDIEYLRTQNENLNKKLGVTKERKDEPQVKEPQNSSRFINLEQERLNQQMELQ